MSAETASVFGEALTFERLLAGEDDPRRRLDLLTGRIEDINNIRRRLGLYDSDDITQHMGLLTFGNEPTGKWGATPALDAPKNILYFVLRRVDPFKYTDWPTVTPAVTASGNDGVTP